MLRRSSDWRGRWSRAFERTVWRDHQLGQVWALEVIDGQIAGCAGPLGHDNVGTDDLNNLSYERNPGLLSWIEGRRRSRGMS
jgi:hypothetical protein